MINGRAGTLSTPFAPFIEAMPEFEVLLSVLANGGNIDIEHAGIGLVNLLAELSVVQPLLLVFDDAQALDESSIAILPYITGVSERANLSLLFGAELDEGADAGGPAAGNVQARRHGGPCGTADVDTRSAK